LPSAKKIILSEREHAADKIQHINKLLRNEVGTGSPQN
jgi:hypothetical protein